MTGCYEGDGAADRENSREVSGGSKVTFCVLFSRERPVRGVAALTGIMLTPTLWGTLSVIGCSALIGNEKGNLI